jgi:transposase
MLRRVRVDGKAVSVTAARFGFSRPSFYAARERFESEGLAGIVPRRSRPHAGHKLTEEVVDFLEEVLVETPSTRPSRPRVRVESIPDRDVEVGIGRLLRRGAVFFVPGLSHQTGRQRPYVGSPGNRSALD